MKTALKYCSLALILLLSAGHLSAQIVQAVSEKLSFIGGIITEPTDGSISLHLTENHITQQKKIYQIPLDHEGEFRFEFPLKKTTVLTVSYAGKEAEIYMEPGDALRIIAEGNNIAETLLFEGKAAVHNEYLRGVQNTFANFSDEAIGQEIIKSSSRDFRVYMDKIRAARQQFLNNFLQERGGQFSKDFRAYAEADIEYWWAYQLMRYRNEYPAGNKLSVPMSLPTDYYNFLREMNLSNDLALINRYYLYFLDVFLEFAKENPREWREISLGSDKIVVRNSAVMLLKDDSGLPLVMPIDKGKVLHIRDERLLDEKLIIAEDYYQIEAFGGLVGWVRGRDIAYSNQKPSEEKDDRFTETREVETSKIETFIRGNFHRTEIREFPNQNRVVGYLYSGEEAEFLLNQTTDRFPYRYLGTTYSDYWYKIRKQDGTTGWVFRGGVRLLERKVTKREVKEVTYRMSNEAAKAYLNGESLYYALAKDIYDRAHTEDQRQLKDDVFNFIRINPIEKYDRTVQGAYENALRRRAGMKTQNFGSSQVIKVATPPASTKKKPSVKKEKKKTPVSELVEIDNLPRESLKVNVPVAGKVHNATRRKITLVLYSDPILYKEDKRELRLSADGSFQTNFELTQGVFGEIRYAGKVREIWLEPGDDLSLVFDASDLNRTLSFSGQGAVNNKFLQQKQLQFAAQDEEMRVKLQYADSGEYSAFMRKAARERNSFLKQFSAQNRLSSSFANVAAADIQFWSASNLLNYPYEHPLYHNQPAPLALGDDYYSFLDNISAPESGLPAKNYIYFLQQYIDRLESQNKGQDALESVRTHLSEEAYWFSKAKSLAASCRRGNLTEAGIAIQQFINDCPYDNFSNILRFAYNEAKGLAIGAKAPDFELTDIKGQSVRLSDFIGKVIYIDFWATWCAPCRRYLPHSQRLASEYGEDEVVFLYISLDDNKRDWENYIQNHGLHGVHLNVQSGHGYHSKIAELYKVKSLPSYFLVDKNGRIAQSPAANPAGSKIKEQIQELR